MVYSIFNNANVHLLSLENGLRTIAALHSKLSVRYGAPKFSLLSNYSPFSFQKKSTLQNKLSGNNNCL